jgi:two-component system sensor histidine kinase AlgZ
LRRVSTPLAATLGFGIILLITAGLSEAAFFLVLDELAFTPMPKDMHAEFLLCNLGISAIFGGIALRYFYVQQQWRRQIQAETEARRQALQARIRPHFLFNSLNTITSLVEAHPRRAEQALLDLADLFRASLDNKHGLIPLADELELVQHYLNIEQLRLGDRLQVKWATDDLPQDALVPVLSIQPLIENAVYYGIEPTPQGGMIDIQGDYDNDKIRISIHSPLPKAQPSTRQHSSQMAQDNIRERLHVYFGKQGNLVVASDRSTYQVDMHLRYTRTPP